MDWTNNNNSLVVVVVVDIQTTKQTHSLISTDLLQTVMVTLHVLDQ